jgi:hypothetical protein
MSHPAILRGLIDERVVSYTRGIPMDMDQALNFLNANSGALMVVFTCNGLRISELMLENIICSQLELNENEPGSRLELIENELALNENSLRTSVSARIN